MKKTYFLFFLFRDDQSELWNTDRERDNRKVPALAILPSPRAERNRCLHCRITEQKKKTNGWRILCYLNEGKIKNKNIKDELCIHQKVVSWEYKHLYIVTRVYWDLLSSCLVGGINQWQGPKKRRRRRRCDDGECKIIIYHEPVVFAPYRAGDSGESKIFPFFFFGSLRDDQSQDTDRDRRAESNRLCRCRMTEQKKKTNRWRILWYLQ